MKSTLLIVRLSALLISSFFLTNIYATNYYVDPSSPVSIANGTLANPWKTIAQVNSGTTALSPGDTVFFKRGQLYTGRLLVTSSGSSTRPIVYTAYGTGNMPELTYTTSDVIVITNRQYVVIDNLRIIDKTMNTTDHSIVAKIPYAIILNNSPHCSIINCEITLVGIAISVQPGSDFTTISGNNIYNLRAVRNTIGGDDDYGANAMVLATSFNLISNNTFRDCWATSYDYGYDGGAIEYFGTTISDNKILYNTAIDCDGFMEVGSSTYGISTNNLVAYNKILNCNQTACMHNKSGTFGINTDNLQFYNNVIVTTKRQFEPISCLFWFADPTKIDVVILKNNIIYVTTGDNVVNFSTDSLKVAHSNNIYRLVGGSIGLRPGPSEIDIDGQTIFMASAGDPETWDFRLKPGSVGIDFGVNVGLTRDFIGNVIIGNPDAGIFEYASAPVPPPAVVPTKYYADPSSTSALADGSFASPWKTIEQVNSGTISLLPGDTVFFKRGQIFNGTLLAGGTGTAAKPIVYTSYGTGNMPEFTTTTGGDGIVVTNSTYVVLNGLKVDDNTMNVTDHAVQAKIGYGIVLNNSPHCTVTNCEITLVGIGITTRGSSDSTIISGNYIYNLRAVKNTVGGQDDYGANALVIGTSSNIITNNRFDGCWAASYDFGFSGGAIQLFNTHIDNNQVLYNTVSDSKGFLEIGGTSSGTANNSLIAYNKIINCGQTATFHNKLGDGSFIHTTNTQIFNNTIIQTKIQFTPASAMFWYADPTLIDVATMRNNIIWLTTGENVVNNNLDTSKLVHTNNIYKLRGGSLGINLNATEVLLGLENFFTDTTGDPLTWDYRLLPGSRGVDFGVDVGLTRDFIGNAITGAPDAGIFESALVVQPVAARKFYADPSSTSSIANGSFANPWKTIDQVNAGTTALVPGDSVFFKRGQAFTGALVAGGTGTEANPIVYTGYGTGSLPEFTNTTSGVITLTDRRYVILDGLRVTDKTMSTTDHALQAKIGYGIVLFNSSYCTIRNCEITLVGIGIAAEEGSDFTIISGNNISNLRAVRNTVGGTDDYGANAMVISSSSNTISNNRIDGCWATSYDFAFVGGAIQFFNTHVNSNQLLYNTVTNTNGFIEIGGTSNGTSVNNLIAYNKIINCGQTGIFHNKLGDGSYINTTGTRIFNNVIVQNKIQFSPASAMFWYADPTVPDVAEMRNNIVWFTTGENVVNNNLDTAKFIHTNNIYKLRGGTLGVNKHATELIVSDGLIFSDTTGLPENWDYRLVPGSPAINFGADVNLTRDFAGNPIIGNPDAGIYENQTVTPIPPLTATIRAGIINCNGGVTSIDVRATGGVLPYSGIGTFTVGVGAYSYVVVDALGAKDTVSITLTQPAKLNLALAVRSVVHSATDTTSILATASGGVSPYRYQLNAGAFQSSGIFAGLVAGSYAVTARDTNACTVTQNISITAIPVALPPVASIQAGAIKCFGGTAVISVTATGGTTPYSGTGNFTVTAGTYQYIVTDAAGLKDTVGITLTQPTQLILNLVSRSILHTANDTTSIIATSTGGTIPYRYQLNTGSFQASGIFVGVKAGTYSVMARDTNACTVTQSITLTVIPNPLVAAAQAGTIKCFGGTSVVTVTARGGTTPYSGTGSFTVTAGTYRYIVTDAGGLKDTVDITLTEPTKLTLNLSYGKVYSVLDTTSITAVASGGTSPYSYQLNNGLFQSSGMFPGVYPGSYTMTTKDVNTCLVSQTVQVLISPIVPPNKKFYITVYPNPSSTLFTLTIIKIRNSNSPAKIQVFNSNGGLVYSTTGPANLKYTFGSDLPPGTYTVVVQSDGAVQALLIIKL